MVKKFLQMRSVFLVVAMAAFFSLTGCGGSDSTNTPASATLISGQVVDGPISGATCNAYQVNANGTKGTLVGGPVISNASGNYTISMSFSGPVIIECAGGSYKDWATGATVSLTATDLLSAVVPNATGSVSVQVTPLTHMAALAALKDVESGATVATAISNANSEIANYFGLSDILNTAIIDPTVAGSATGASQASKDYSLVLAGIAQYAKDNGITNPFAFVTALAKDASDGTFDGKDGATQLMVGSANLSADAATSGLSTAIAAFANNSSGAAISPAITANLGTSTGVFSMKPSITSFTPTSGDVGATVTITGTNFDATAANNVVRFNGTAATVTAATETTLTTTVPTGATTGTITVTAGMTTRSSTSFTVTNPTPPADPTITSFAPASGAGGASVTITGTNLTVVTEVLFTGPNPSTSFVSGTITAQSATSITVTVPAALTAGGYTISLLYPGHELAAVSEFTVTTGGGGGSGSAADYLSKKAIGNSWTLAQTGTMNGQPYPEATGTTTITVTAASGTGVDITTTSTIAPTTTGRLELNGAGDLVYTSGGSTLTYLPATFSVGTTYVHAPAITGQGVANATIAAIGVTRTVPAGTFTDCIQINYTKTNPPPSGTVTNVTMYLSISAGSAVEQTYNLSGPGLTLILTQQLQAGYVANP